MNPTSYHQTRTELIEHTEALSDFAREIGSSQVDFSDHLVWSEPPAMIAVIGNPDSGTHEVISSLIQDHLEPAAEDEEKKGIDYHFTHSVWNDPKALEELENATSYATNATSLDKLSFVEVFARELTGTPAIKPVVAEAQGVIFVIDARDPWSGRTWKHFENYLHSHEGRILFFLNRLECIDERDWEVLRKHLQDKVTQLSGEGIEISMANEESSFQAAREYLAGTTINQEKWERLKPLSNELSEAMSKIQETLHQQSNWQVGAKSFSDDLDQDIITVRRSLDHKIRANIQDVGHSFSGKAQGIIEETRATFTTKAYLRSFVKNSISLESFNTRLEEAVTETLYGELSGCNAVISGAIQEHATKFQEEHPQLASRLPKFQEKVEKVPVVLDKQSVQEEVHKTMLELDVKKMFKEQLYTIDITTNNRLKLVMLICIIAAAVGVAGFHIIGLVLLGFGLAMGFWGLHLRTRAINDFCDFLEEWFMGFGPRMKGSTELLGGKVVNHAVTYYKECFTPVLDIVGEHDTEMPARSEKARELAERNRYLIQVLMS